MSGEAAGQTTDPVLARFLRSLAARDASPHTQRAYATAVGSYLDWLAARGTDWRRPTRADLRAYLGVLGRGPRTIVRRAAAGRDPLVPSLGDPRAISRRATRGARSPRRASRAGCRASSRSSRSTRCSRSSRRTSRPSRATTPSRPHSGSRWPCATARWSRPPTPPGCASASSRRRRSVRSTSGAARSASWARGARSGSGCWAARRDEPLADYLEDGRPVLLERSARRRAAAGRDLPEPPRPPARGARPALPLRPAVRARRPAGRGLAAHAPPLVRDAPARRRRRPAGRPGAARATRTWRRPRSTRTSRPVDSRPPIGRPTRGRGATRPRDRRPGHSPGPGSSSRARSSSRACSATSASSSSATSGLLAGELDTFFAAFRLPDLIFQLVAAGALSSALIPIVSGAVRGRRARSRTRGVSSRRSSTSCSSRWRSWRSACSSSRRSSIGGDHAGLRAAQLEKTVELTRIMLLSPIFLALGAVATSVLNSGGRFAAAAAGPDRLQPRRSSARR